MKNVGRRTRTAMLAGSLVFAGGASGAMAQGSAAYEDRGRVGPQALVEQALHGKQEQLPQPVAAEVKALVVTGTVMSIDRDARSVVLSDDTGEEITVEIPADATSFDQLKVGDRIDVNILQPLELAPPSSPPPTQ